MAQSRHTTAGTINFLVPLRPRNAAAAGEREGALPRPETGGGIAPAESSMSLAPASWGNCPAAEESSAASPAEWQRERNGANPRVCVAFILYFYKRDNTYYIFIFILLTIILCILNIILYIYGSLHIKIPQVLISLYLYMVYAAVLSAATAAVSHSTGLRLAEIYFISFF